MFAKFKLIEKYYYLYENTFNVLDAFKLSQIVVELIYKQPQLHFTDDRNNAVTF